MKQPYYKSYHNYISNQHLIYLYHFYYLPTIKYTNCSMIKIWFASSNGMQFSADGTVY
ncbi:conserved hypothetical protein [Trichinella spiralis]|uniref:hypothetical protein n=1 Tax=Trichinella spiralis TaxID=6334 RepID=UPI0001EFE226|nr:conserved hypothetical protein [Trichinella spiralis]